MSVVDGGPTSPDRNGLAWADIPEVKAALGLTHRCNLSCRYCYAGPAFARDMPLPTVRKAVDFLLQETPPEVPIRLSFFGGEPLLCFGLMQEIVGYIHDCEQASGRRIHLSITTNGTILSRAILDFLREERVDLCISIDGPAYVHDLNRVTTNGQGSFARVHSNLCQALEALAYVQVNAVYGPDTLQFLPEVVSFLAETDIAAVHLNPNIRAVWSPEVFPTLRRVYSQIADYYISSYRAGREIAINVIDSKIVVMLKGGHGPSARCYMGEAEWGFAPSGNIYPCERLIGDDDNESLCIGNIHTGLDPERRRAVIRSRGNRNVECATCELKAYCRNDCGCTNYHLTGSTDLMSPAACEIEKATIRAAARVLAALQDNDLFLKHFAHYICTDRQGTSSQVHQTGLAPQRRDSPGPGSEASDPTIHHHQPRAQSKEAMPT